MATRMSRPEQVQRNRRLVLEAARRVFLERGYAGATLEAIADDAGFSKGVVYSQFRSKGDLFIALLEQRIAERGAQNEAVTRRARGLDAIRALLRAGRQDGDAEPRWGLLLLEFRVHAAREPALNRRYAEAHRRAIDGIAALLARFYQEAAITPAADVRQLATLIVAWHPGVLLERAVDPRGLTQGVVDRAIFRLLGLPETDRAKETS
jgi:AcrR family transcriptional regulator